MDSVRYAASKHVKWWPVFFLPLLLRALIPVGFMPMVGANYSLQLVVCDGDGPMSVPTSLPLSMPRSMPMPMSMDMPAGMVMGDAGGSPGSPGHHHDHAERGSCPYGSAPALGALPTLATLPRLLLQPSLKVALATAQVANIEASPRSQSARAPPV
jgi:hypothetical protein